MQITAFIFFVVAGNIPADICQLSDLRCLYLSHNRFNGSKFTRLALSSDSSDCILNEGNIPAELSQLSFLRSLYLNNNLLTGIS